MRSFRPSRQESQRLEHKSVKDAFLQLLSKDTKESRGKMKKDHKKQDRKGELSDKKEADEADKSCKDWNTRTIRDTLLNLLSKDTRQPMGHMD
ncbi:hypothetical protein RRG08_038487 [Elysia crispata]|uniref:Uncharacterized protein n=1 Tax=Elysia crispata TaxID=231223 RepID=A0AAE1AJA2_9GAST|nr:hypothetical protein RRG08_038487 [Elysia crispata]